MMKIGPTKSVSKLSNSNLKYFFVAIQIASVSIVESKIFTKCELGIDLISNGIQTSELPKWICLANSVSSFDSSLITGTNPALSKEFGIFQITNYYYCYSEEKPTNNDCNLNCTELADDDLKDDIRCASLIKRRQGFSAWTGYKQSCENQSLDFYIAGCDFNNGVPPKIINTKVDLILYLNSTQERIVCEAEGSPPIKLKWLKFDKEVRPIQYPTETNSNASTNTTSSTIIFGWVLADTAGNYTCDASSAYGQSRKTFVVRVRDNATDNTEIASYAADTSSGSLGIIIATPAIIILLMTGLVFFLCYRVRSFNKDKKSGLSKNQINAFYEGLPFKDLPEAEPSSSILGKVRAEHYKKLEFEIPDCDLDIDNNVVLGSGQFGIVYKGTYKKETLVAVKTIVPQEKPEETTKQLQALLDEIKVMSFIGKHPNIVKLVGAQTKEWRDDKVFIVLEYCPIGSLKSYLKLQRSKDIQQCPDYSKKEDGVQTCAKSNYDKIPEQEEVYVRDFVSYAHQIAYAMDYLTQKKIIHADLATRNVLLLNTKVVKVTDFGLSKRLCYDKEYVKNNQEFVPWRWWAIESLLDFTFTTKSDVWSYGVTLWEIFSLAYVPYPEYNWSDEFIEKLNLGHRLRKPELASDQIYAIMTHCWQKDPKDRPSFQQICNILNQTLRKMSQFKEEYANVSENPTILQIPA